MRPAFGVQGRTLVLTPLILMLAVILTSCAQIMRDDSGGQGSASAPDPGVSRSSPAVYSRTYYLSPSGSDSAAGTSPSTAWRTLAQASSVVLHPGTRLLLQGGRRFTGELQLGHRDAGSAAHPVLIGSYGRGQATIVERKSNAISIQNTAGLVIQDLSIVGRGLAFRYGLGIEAYSSRTGKSKLDGLQIDHVSISGFVDGISIGATGTAGFRNVLVRDTTLSGNLDNGMMTWGPTFDPAQHNYANENVRVQRVAAFGNQGDPNLTAHNTGSGIVLGSVRDGEIAWSTACDNGGHEGSHQGPDGIWAYDSTHIVIEHDLAYQNLTNDATDGDGFGLDQNTSDSVMQYNLSYRNDGAGYLLYTGLDNGAQTHNVVRFNISSADVRDQNEYYGGISVLGFVKDSAIYQNTVIMPPQAVGPVPALQLSKYIKHDTVHNNIFAVHSGAVIAAKAYLRPGQVELQGNDYYSAAYPWTVDWDGSLYSSIAAWRSATGEEMLKGRPVGTGADPDLVGPYLGLRVKTPGGTAAGFALRAAHPSWAPGWTCRACSGWIRARATTPAPRSQRST